VAIRLLIRRRNTFNAYGESPSATDPLGHVTSYKYDGNRNRTVVIDGDLHQTTRSTMRLANPFKWSIRWVNL